MDEYWIADWRTRRLEVYRRQSAQLHLVSTLYEADTLETPLLPGFSTRITVLFEGIR